MKKILRLPQKKVQDTSINLQQEKLGSNHIRNISVEKNNAHLTHVLNWPYFFSMKHKVQSQLVNLRRIKLGIFSWMRNGRDPANTETLKKLDDYFIVSLLVLHI